MPLVKSTFLALIVWSTTFCVSAQTVDSLQSELTLIEEQVAKATETINSYEEGLIRTIAELRRETLLLSAALIENRILTETTGTATEIVVPIIQPDEEKATQLLGEMASELARIQEAEAEAENAGGLIKAISLSRVETEKLTLAQLQMAYFQAKFGIVFPTAEMGQNTASPLAEPSTPSNESDTVTEALPWADPRFPEIDYSLAYFESAYQDGRQISGWWTIETERAQVDDSLKVTAINLSQAEHNTYSGLTALFARCSEGETAIIFVQDDYLMSDFRRNSFDIIYWTCPVLVPLQVLI